MPIGERRRQMGVARRTKPGHTPRLMIDATKPRDIAQAPCYDATLGAWMLSRFADVSAALADERLIAGVDGDDRQAHIAVRQAARRAFNPKQLEHLMRSMENATRECITRLRFENVDLVRDFATPWSLALAAATTGAPSDELPRLDRLARTIFVSAAHTMDGAMSGEAKAAAAELARVFPGAHGSPSIDVQAFVALSQTLPHFLGAAWLALFEQFLALTQLRADDTLVDEAVEEMLRLAGPSRVVFRRTIDDVEIGGARIEKGARVVLQLACANRDPARFPNPDALCFGRGSPGHLAFSRGAHFCSGASLVRSSVASTTRALLSAKIDVAVCSVTWIDGFAIRGVESLVVTPRGA